jgi:hypothetical protein
MEMIWARARKSLESLYDCTADIYGYEHNTDETDGITSLTEILLKEGVPCRLSYSSFSPAAQTDDAAAISQSVKLFLPPDVKVSAGSRLIVSGRGGSTIYKCSGVAAKFATHQEVNLILDEEEA